LQRRPRVRGQVASCIRVRVAPPSNVMLQFAKQRKHRTSLVCSCLCVYRLRSSSLSLSPLSNLSSFSPPLSLFPCVAAGMACSIEGIQPEFVPPGLLCSDTYCDQLAELLVNESALDELWRAQGKQNSCTVYWLSTVAQMLYFIVLYTNFIVKNCSARFFGASG
jgi:hypothetical protein